MKRGEAMDSFEKVCRENSGIESFAAVGGVSPHTPFPVNNIKHVVVVKGVRSTPPIIPPTQTTTTGFVGITFEEVLDAANRFGIPEWYAAYWFKAMNANGWVTSGGVPINNWRPFLRKWWQRATELEKAKVEADYLAEQKSAAEVKADPEPVIAFTKRHWWMCQSKCLNYKHGKCLCGGKRPACFCACNDGFTERCKGFKAVPWAWQNVWLLAPEEWEAHWAVDAWGKKYLHPGWKTKAKGQRVKAYFDAHVEELEEAKWRDEANAVTDVEVRDADVYLAWVERARNRVIDVKPIVKGVLTMK